MLMSIKQMKIAPHMIQALLVLPPPGSKPSVLNIIARTKPAIYPETVASEIVFFPRTEAISMDIQPTQASRVGHCFIPWHSKKVYRDSQKHIASNPIVPAAHIILLLMLIVFKMYASILKEYKSSINRWINIKIYHIKYYYHISTANDVCAMIMKSNGFLRSGKH